MKRATRRRLQADQEAYANAFLIGVVDLVGLLAESAQMALR